MAAHPNMHLVGLRLLHFWQGSSAINDSVAADYQFFDFGKLEGLKNWILREVLLWIDDEVM